MLKKSFWVFTLSLLSPFVLLFAPSCLNPTEGSITNVCFQGINPSSDTIPDKFLSEVGFAVFGYFDTRMCAQNSGFSFINTCFATKKCIAWQNDFATSTFALSLNRQLIISSDTIPPGTDLFKNTQFRLGTVIEKKLACAYVEATIILSDDLKNKITFEQGTYEVYFNCSTTDGKNFNKSRRVVFKQ